MPTEPNPTLSLAEEVASAWRECGEIDPESHPEEWHTIGGVSIQSDATDAAMVNVLCDFPPFSACRLPEIGKFPGIRAALVGALVQWLFAKADQRVSTSSYGKGAIVRVTDSRGYCYVDESDATDHLLALCRAARAVVVALAAWFVLWLAQKAVRKWATWMRVEQEDERCTKEDTYSVEEKKK